VEKDKDREMNRLIAKHYVKDPGGKQEIIAGDIAVEQEERREDRRGWSADNIKKHIQDLTDRKVLDKHVGIMDWEEMGYPFEYRVDVHLDVETLREGPDFGAPKDESTRNSALATNPVDSWHGVAYYIMNDLIKFWERVEKKTVSGKTFSADDLLLLDVVILLGQQADLTLTLRARDQDAVLSFVVDGLRAMRAVRMTSTSHNAWSYAESNWRAKHSIIKKAAR